MAAEEGELQALNPAGTDVPAESSPATEQPVPEAVTESSGESDTSQSEKEKPKGGFQRRISELVRREREAREEAARERAEKHLLMQRLGTPETSGEPKRDQFDSWDDYESAKTRYILRQELQSVSKESREAEKYHERQQQEATLHEEWTGRLDAARESFDDIDEYVEVVGQRLDPELAQVIKASDKGPEIVRHLGQHPKDLARIAALPSGAAVYELVKIETRLSERPKSSAAPNPVNPVKTTTAPANPLRDDAPIGDWMKARRGQVRP